MKSRGYIAVAAVVVFAALLPLLWRVRGSAAPRLPTHRRPGAAYRPTTLPLRHAERPELPVRRRRIHGEAEAGDGEQDGWEAAESGPIPDDDPDLLALVPSRHFSSLVWTALEEDDGAILDKGALLLDSPHSEHRALGGVMLFFAKGLADEFISAIVEDEDPMVPLTVFDWIRDFGSDEDVRLFAESLAESHLLDEDLLFAYALESGLQAGGGRSALHLWLGGFSGRGVPVEGLAGIVASRTASLDVREQALFKLLEPGTRERGLAALEAMAGGGGENGALMAQTLDKLRTVADISNAEGYETKIWDSESVVIYFLSESEEGLPARDLANYLEYALRRDDPEFPPAIEEGTWEFANDFLQRMQPLADTLRPEELDALDRIALSLDRLVNYDPAFNPFEKVPEGEDPEQEFFEDEDGGNDGEDDAPGT